VVAARVELEAATARSELMASDAGEIGGVHEQFGLSDAQGQDVGDVGVGDGIAIAVPIDKAIDAAEAIDDARRVVGVARQGQEVRLLVGEALEGRADLLGSMIGDAVEPVFELGLQIGEVAEGAAVEERGFKFPK